MLRIQGTRLATPATKTCRWGPRFHSDDKSLAYRSRSEGRTPGSVVSTGVILRGFGLRGGEQEPGGDGGKRDEHQSQNIAVEA